jgi:hypothetical protein
MGRGMGRVGVEGRQKGSCAVPPARILSGYWASTFSFSLADRRGRRWQCGTLQLGLVLPEQFEARYVGRFGVRSRPVLLHRATLGSLERFLGILLEHHAGDLPVWLAPDQAVILPVAAAYRPFGSGHWWGGKAGPFCQRHTGHAGTGAAEAQPVASGSRSGYAPGSLRGSLRWRGGTIVTSRSGGQ